MAYNGLYFNWSPDYAFKPQVIDAVAYETDLVEVPLTPTEISLMSFYDELGRQAALNIHNTTTDKYYK